jgi:hypothetical protein
MIWEREEVIYAQLIAANGHLATSTARASALERKLRVAKSSLETSTVMVVDLKITLERTKKLLESTYAEGGLPLRLSSSLRRGLTPMPRTCAGARRECLENCWSYDFTLVLSR